MFPGDKILGWPSDRSSEVEVIVVPSPADRHMPLARLPRHWHRRSERNDRAASATEHGDPTPRQHVPVAGCLVATLNNNYDRNDVTTQIDNSQERLGFARHAAQYYS